MESIVIVSPQLAEWGAFTSVLAEHCPMTLIEVSSGTQAMVMAKEKKPVAMVIDQDLGDMAGIDLVLDLLETNALINVALTSDQSEADFHQATEGLGILMKLPSAPDGQWAVKFYERLKGVI